MQFLLLFINTQKRLHLNDYYSNSVYLHVHILITCTRHLHISCIYHNHILLVYTTCIRAFLERQLQIFKVLVDASKLFSWTTCHLSSFRTPSIVVLHMHPTEALVSHILGNKQVQQVLTKRCWPLTHRHLRRRRRQYLASNWPLLRKLHSE